MRLSNQTLSQLPQQVVVPNYDRNKLKTKIVHLGFGAFHRAHQAVYADILASEQGSDWGYCEVNLIGGEKQIEDLKQQDYLFSVCEMSYDDWSTRVVGVVKQALHADVDGISKVLEVMTRPEIAIVSITVTEKGYCYLPTTASIDTHNELIKYDIANPTKPKTVPGVIVEALRLRQEKGLPAFTVMSCDNMPENGHVTRNVVLALAKMHDAKLAQWIEENVSFPSTMVDRIVPAATSQTMEKIQQQLGGIDDPAGIAGEPFKQWVIEDNFVAGRPQWQKAGAELVNDVLPYEEMKLRMLNGSHSFLAYLGYLGGYRHIDECMQDANYVKAARHLMLQEQAPTLKVIDVDLQAYADSLLDRYRNTGLKHRTWQIAMDGTLKLPQRMLDSIRYHLAHNTAFDCLALGVAAWMRYVSGIDDAGHLIEVCDPSVDKIKALVANSADNQERVKALLSLTHVFGEDLTNNSKFIDQVTEAYISLRNIGAKQTVEKLAQNFS
ncbi:MULTISPECIES: mannitol dehydrogenase family protein [unclassified Gilliamella]|uniref:mannitol dehydrogenase family protein n=1 Tax=unclassified Gilliamella TaxID=2685620 RepID=UPI00226A26A1|nr:MULTISPECIES: fructuronate reductase [unclassified Gilliamella]MCX8600458.1 fructuronate reductase [Gilliamella sp. B3722]MCX8609453.1 fructuronate reductase [Gilliamella sp. B3771]MCX8612238.1 fructuronate reductase [Gilliamella sp. B3773]MCX8615659.1 fructuronate reductase [Gilliamella sp. B3770]MCX8619378.1 fructuronate reductase [Gilliamella sp. B3892]